jgi:hypothetical protein
MTTTLADISLGLDWIDITDTHASAASADVLIQNVGGADEVHVVFGGASAPTGKTGVSLARLDSVSGNAANVWVRPSVGVNSSLISVTLL